MKKTLAIVALCLTIGCLDVPAMNGIMDRIIPEPKVTYNSFEVWTGEGNFAPDDEQNTEDLVKAALDLAGNPLQFQQTIQYLSWKEY